MQTKIAREKELAEAMARRETSGFDEFDFEDSSIASTDLHDSLRYVAPLLGLRLKLKVK